MNDFIDPDRPERKREVQRRVEAKQENNSSTTKVNNGDVNSDKVAEENSSIVDRVVSFFRGILQ